MSKVNDSDVSGFMIWRVAPPFVGASPLLGPGTEGVPRDTNTSFSVVLVLLSSSWVPGMS